MPKSHLPYGKWLINVRNIKTGKRSPDTLDSYSAVIPGTIHPLFPRRYWCVLELAGLLAHHQRIIIAPSRLISSGMLRYAPIYSCGTATDFHRTSLLSQTMIRLAPTLTLYSIVK